MTPVNRQLHASTSSRKTFVQRTASLDEMCQHVHNEKEVIYINDCFHIHHHAQQHSRSLPTCSRSVRHAQATTYILHVGLTHQRWAAHRTRLAWRTLLSLHAGAAPASFLRGLLFSSSTPPEHPARTPSSRAGTACRRRQGSTCSGPRLCAAARAGCASGRGWWCRTSGTCNVPQSLHSAPRCR